MLINLVLGFFSLLIVLSILKFVFPNVKEGATGSCDLEKDPTYLAKLNAAKLMLALSFQAICERHRAQT